MLRTSFVMFQFCRNELSAISWSEAKALVKRHLEGRSPGGISDHRETTPELIFHPDRPPVSGTSPVHLLRMLGVHKWSTIERLVEFANIPSIEDSAALLRIPRRQS